MLSLNSLENKMKRYTQRPLCMARHHCLKRRNSKDRISIFRISRKKNLYFMCFLYYMISNPYHLVHDMNTSLPDMSTSLHCINTSSHGINISLHMV